MIETKQDIGQFIIRWNLLNRASATVQENLEYDALKLWDELVDVAVIETYKEVSLDKFSEVIKGLPITNLKGDGRETLYDIHDYDEYELTLIDGIGEKSAHAIYDVKEKMKDALKQSTRPTFDADNLTELQVSFLTVFYKLINYKSSLKEISRLKTQLDKEMTTLIPTLKEKKNAFFSLFQSKVKKLAIDEAIERVNTLVNDVKQLEEHVSFFTSEPITKSDIMNDFINQNATYFAEIEKLVGATHDADVDLSQDEIDDIFNFPIQLEGMKATLRSYQDFGAKYALTYKRTLLGDEMGLGKTMQGLAMFNHLHNEREQIHGIVVCPLSLLSNWDRETKKFTSLQTYIFHGAKRDSAKAAWLKRGGLLITTYEHTMRLELDQNNSLDAIVVDEAHYIKIPAAKRTKSVNSLLKKAEYALLMTGTPIENRLDEMKQLISVLNKSIADEISTDLYYIEPNKFRQLVAPVYLRRNRDDVLEELPELSETTIQVPFGKEEREVYEQGVLSGNMMLMRRAAWTGGSPEKSPKLERLLQICEEAKENDRKVLVFSFFRSVLDVVTKHLGENTYEPISGDVSPSERQVIIDEFTAGPAGSVLVSQITAGGVGLNIQAASIVILCEPQWKPSTEVQAISRAYRMGQARNVIVYRLYTEDSVDITMDELLHKKQEIFDQYAKESDVGNESLSRAEVNDRDKALTKQILAIEKERLEKKEFTA